MFDLDDFTPELRAKMGPFADAWIERVTRCGPADRATVEDGIRRCYEAAGIPWHGNVVWVDSPIAAAVAGPIASLFLNSAVRGADAVGGAVDGAVRDAARGAVDGAVDDAVTGAVTGAVRGAVDDAVRGAVHDAVTDAARGAVDDAVDDAVRGAVRGAVDDAVDGAVTSAVDDAVDGAVTSAVGGAVHGAVTSAVGGAVHGAVDDAVRGAVRGAVTDAARGAVDGAVHDAVTDAARGAVGGAVHGAVTSAVDDAVRGAVHDAVTDAARGAVDDAVHDAVTDAARGAVKGAVGDAVRGAVTGAVTGAVDDAVKGAVRGAVHGAVGGAVGGTVTGAVDGAVHGAVRGAVRDAVGDAVTYAVHDAVRVDVTSAVDGAVGGAVTSAARVAVHDAVRGAVRVAVRGAVTGAVRGAVTGAVERSWWRVMSPWWSWTSWRTFIVTELGIPELEKVRHLVDAWDDASGAGWWWPHRDFVIISDRPTAINREQISPSGWGSHVLHCETGPSISWRNEWSLWHWHGIQVPSWVIEDCTVERIKAEENTEIRRCAIEAYGWDRYLEHCSAELVHECDDPGNPGHRLRLYDVEDMPYETPTRLLIMENASRDRDGSRRTFAETVPASCRKADEAAAWQFDVPVADYRQLARAT